MSYPYQPGPPRAAPPSNDSNVLFIVLAIIGGVVVLGGGGCLLCVGLVATSADEPPTTPLANPTTTTASPSPSPSPAPSPAPAPAPAPAAPAPAPRGGDTASVDGRYECFQLRVVAGPSFSYHTQWVPGALPGFTIAGGAYTSSGQAGSVSVASTVVAFDGGYYGGWRGTTSTNSTGFFILFRGKDHANPQPGVGAKSGDYQCYRQK